MKPKIEDSGASLPVEIIQSKIYLIRGRKVMFDNDLAELYGVSTGRLKEQVRRNLRRFPADFMFELTFTEEKSSRSQNATLKRGGNIKYSPYVFTEQGVAMLSSVLNSNRAIDVNIQIMRVFTKLREMMISHTDLTQKIKDLEKEFQNKSQEHDRKFILVFDAIKQLLKEKEESFKNKGPMGFFMHPPRDTEKPKQRRCR